MRELEEIETLRLADCQVYVHLNDVEDYDPPPFVPRQMLCQL
jgi:hypothetical protein